jgi:hypothetical protein
MPQIYVYENIPKLEGNKETWDLEEIGSDSAGCLQVA